MMAAARAAALGALVTLYEKQPKLGSKLAISGKGRCNLTNAGDLDDFIGNLPGNGPFLYSALNAFSNQDLIIFFHGLGVLTKVERGKRVFPLSDDSKEVVRAFQRHLAALRVRVRLGCPVRGILTSNKANGPVVTGIYLNNGHSESADAVILATGGASYPGTGSTGDGYRMAEELGHRIIPVRPSLVPLKTKEVWVKDLQGLTLKNVAVSLRAGRRELAAQFGELLFTHFGVSGPVVLTLSRRAVVWWLTCADPLTLMINLKPALSAEQLDKRLQRDFTAQSRKHLANVLPGLVPLNLAPVIIGLANIPGNKPVHQINKEERRRLGFFLQNLSLTLTGSLPLAAAIVTAGGVAVTEVVPRTMQSKLVRGLYLAGEVLDIDGFTGGYNLQAAFSTGWVAGEAAATS
jgi:predicted Rossmann fold flavoprotein